MQQGMFRTPGERYDTDGVVARINALAGATRSAGGLVVFVQHDGPEGDAFEPGAPGWELLPSLDRRPGDPVVHKTACDAFYRTELASVLEAGGRPPLLVTGCATDFCVDTTVRAAASHDFDLVVVSDGHTTADRPHLDAPSIIEHHNATWRGLIVPGRQVRVRPAAELLRELESNAYR